MSVTQVRVMFRFYLIACTAKPGMKALSNLHEFSVMLIIFIDWPNHLRNVWLRNQ
jgi:hypothetical protein